MRRKWLIGLVVLVVLAGLVVWLARTPEPSYRGRSASAWLDLLEIPGADREHVIAAFKAMGRDAAPFLARELEWKATWLYGRLWALKYRSRLPAWLKQRIPESKDRRASAALVFPNLGPDAEPALPTLLRLFRSGDPDEKVRYGVCATLGALGGRIDFMVPELTESLIEGQPYSRGLCADLLADIGAKAKTAVPALEEAVKEEGWLSRSAARALLKIDGRTNLAVEVFLQCLDHPDLGLQCSALNDLHDLGSAAIPAAPRIEQALLDTEEFVREAAARALREIDPARWERSLQQLNRDLPAQVDRLIGRLQSGDPGQWRRVAQALAVVGPNAKAAVPALTDVLRMTSSAKLRLPGSGVMLASTMAHAAAALGEIGPEARDAVPVLIERVLDQQGGGKCAYCQALGRIGPAAREALPALRVELISASPEVRLSAAVAITRIDPEQSRDAVLVLQDLRNHPAPMIRLEVAPALWKLDPTAPSPIATLMSGLKNSPEADQDRRAELLGEVGPGAKDAIPVLGELVQDRTLWKARRSAAIAIRKIDPEAAARLGLPGLLALP